MDSPIFSYRIQITNSILFNHIFIFHFIFSQVIKSLTNSFAMNELSKPRKEKELKSRNEESTKKCTRLEQSIYGGGLMKLKRKRIPSHGKKLTKNLMKDVHEKDGRVRHKCNPLRIHNLAIIHRKNLGGLQQRSKLLKRAGFLGVFSISRWTKIPEYFVRWVIENFDPHELQIKLNGGKMLKLSEEDVERVYNLPRGKKEIDLQCSTKESIDKLRIDLGGDTSHNIDEVCISALEKRLENFDDGDGWVKAAILYIISCLLCPTNKEVITLKYAYVLEDLAKIRDYNWCKHVLDHMRLGIKCKVIKNPKADFHFLMINYLDRMGKGSRVSTGDYKTPTASDWDTTDALERMKKLHNKKGLKAGIIEMIHVTKNVISSYVNVLAFDVHSCPIAEAPEYVKHCKEQIKIYSNCLKILKERISKEVDDLVKGDVEKIEARTIKISDEHINISSSPTDKMTKKARIANLCEVTPKDGGQTDGFQSAQQLIDEHVDQFGVEMVTPHKEESSIPTKTTVMRTLSCELDEVMEPTAETEINHVTCIGPLTQQILEAEFGNEHDTPTNGERSVPLPMIFLDSGSDEDKTNVAANFFGSTPMKYMARRSIIKKSKYLRSPYDVHVHESKLSPDKKNLLTFVWTPDLEWEDYIYSGEINNMFNLTRGDLCSLQESELVLSIVIDCWVNLLNMKQHGTRISKIILTAGSAAHLVAEIEKDSVDRRSGETACSNFIGKLKTFYWINWKRMDVKQLEYIMFPVVANGHFVTFVLNLKKRRFEYLTSITKITRTNSIYEELGEWLIKEAIAFMNLLYRNKCQPCQYDWSEFQWVEPNMPEQQDLCSCGVFTMKYLEQWDGEEDQMFSFLSYSTAKTSRKLKFTNQIRMETCLQIVTHYNNTIRFTIQAAANEYCNYRKKELAQLHQSEEVDPRDGEIKKKPQRKIKKDNEERKKPKEGIKKIV